MEYFHLFGRKVIEYKKNDKQRLNNYRSISLNRSISLLLTCSKIFERLIFNEMFGFFIENNLISQHQSGFKPEYSCINQLLSNTHEIYQCLMKVWMSVVCFSTYLRPLIKYGMMVLFSN